MTKHRPPLSVDAALSRIAGRLPGSWKEMAAITGHESDGYLRACGDPSRRERLAIDDAIVLDLAYQAAGGAGAPLYEVYSLKLELETVDRFADQQELPRSVAEVIKETSEAEIAMLAASRPGATPHDIEEAMRESEEGISSLRKSLSILTRLRRQFSGGRDTMPP